MPEWKKSTVVAGLIAGAVLVSSGGCGKPFDVKPKPDRVEVTYKSRSESSGLILEATVVTDEDHLYDTFEANLILAGVLPIHTKISNPGTETMEIQKAVFEVRVDGNQTFKRISASKAYGKLINYYSISVYTKRGYAQSKEDFVAYGMDLTRSLKAGEAREGILFFPLPGDLIKTGSLTLLTKNLPGKNVDKKTPIELKLN